MEQLVIKTIMKKIFRPLALTAALLFAAGPASAQQVVIDPTALVEWFAQIGAMAEQLAQDMANHVEADATIEMANAKNAAAHRAVAEGIASWQEKETLRRENARLSHSLEQPATTCAAMTVAGTAVTVDANVNSSVHLSTASHVIGPRTTAASAAGGTTMTIPAIQNTQNSTQQVVTTYNYVKSNFCTPDEASAGRCAGVTQSGVKYPGGDVRADLLFGDGSGSTGAGAGTLTISTDQNVAVEAFISNLVDNMSPEALRNPAWEQSDAGRKYVLMVRQYAGFMSLSANSLHSIQKNHLIDPTLNMSRMDAADQFIKLKWSPSSIADLATATEPHKILRDIAQMNAYRLWLDFQKLSSEERQESLLAGQLALMTNQYMTPALAQQKAAAIGRGNSSGM